MERVVFNEQIKPYQDLPQEQSKDAIRDMLNKLVVLKLNGGLGTSMGCKGPKSIISVRNELTFLDLTVQQIEVIDNGCYVGLRYVAHVAYNRTWLEYA